MYGSILVVALSLIAQVSDKPRIKYDKFKDRTFISIDLMKVPGEEGYSNISMNTGHAGKNPKKIDEDGWINVHIYRSGKNWRYLRDHDVAVMCGDDHIPFWKDKEPSYDHDMDDGDCNESVGMTFSLETMKRFLAKNQDWEIKIGSQDPFSLGTRQRAKMRSFIKFLEEGRG